VFRKNRVDGWKVTSEKSTAWVVKIAENQVVAFCEGPLEVVGSVVLPTGAILALLLVPFVERGVAKRLAQRTVALSAVAWRPLVGLDSPSPQS